MSSELYTSFYGLRERPFTLLPDPDFLFWSKAHKRAYSVLEYGIMSRAPLTVITGEIGAGKTTLVQALLKSIGTDMVVGLISNAQGGRGDLLRWVLNALDVQHDPQADYVALHQILQDFAITQYANGTNVVLIIDEAQNLTIELLEELRMLTNINSNKDELLQLILVGQPELRTMIESPSLRQFAQRVAAAYHIPSMDQNTTIAYIQHRLRHAGGTGAEFSSEAIASIFRISEGVPRMVNKICDLAMVYGAGSGADVITPSIIRELMGDGIFLKPQTTAPLFLTNRVDATGANRP